MEEKPTIPLPAEPSGMGRERRMVILVGAVAALGIAIAAAVVATAGPASKTKNPALGVAAAGATTASSPADQYSQAPQFTYSAQGATASAGAPGAPVSPGSPPVPTSSPTGANNVPSNPTSPPPASSAVPPPTTSKPAPPPPSTHKATPYNISGTVSCVSGHSVEGVWVQAAQGSGYSPWEAIGSGSTSRYWYTLPDTMSFSVHVGCGGTQPDWAVAAISGSAPGPVANFTCYDVAGQPNYATCTLQ